MNAALLSLPLSVGSVCSTRDIGKENGRGNGMAAAAALKVIKGDGGCRRLPNLTYPSWPACCLPARLPAAICAVKAVERDGDGKQATEGEGGLGRRCGRRGKRREGREGREEGKGSCFS